MNSDENRGCAIGGGNEIALVELDEYLAGE
jgi:hypothetical protein